MHDWTYVTAAIYHEPSARLRTTRRGALEAALAYYGCSPWRARHLVRRRAGGMA